MDTFPRTVEIIRTIVIIIRAHSLLLSLKVTPFSIGFHVNVVNFLLYLLLFTLKHITGQDNIRTI